MLSAGAAHTHSLYACQLCWVGPSLPFCNQLTQSDAKFIQPFALAPSNKLSDNFVFMLSTRPEHPTTCHLYSESSAALLVPVMATTPSPGVNGSPSTPPAPKHGGYLDDWEPYRPRKSVRLASQPKTTASPAASSRPRPKVVSARVNDCPSDGMLLTPKKTPSKAPTTKEGAAIDSLSRDIFGSTSTRVAKKISGSTLESFTAEDVNQDFDIFNDEPNSRIPQKDRSNPFYNPQPSPSTSKKASGKARQVHVPGHGWQSLEEAARRDDGMIASL